MKTFLKHATMKHNLLRALKVGLFVGVILGIINHYDMFLSGNFELQRFVQIVLTFFVPFLVSLHGAAMYGRFIELKK
jgi:thiamine transporter ThiT